MVPVRTPVMVLEHNSNTSTGLPVWLDALVIPQCGTHAIAINTNTAIITKADSHPLSQSSLLCALFIYTHVFCSVEVLKSQVTLSRSGGDC